MVLLAIALVGIDSAFAQSDGKGDGISQEVSVTDVYNPSLNEAFRRYEMPEIRDTVLFRPEIKYDLRPRQIETSFDVEPISMARLKDSKLVKLQKGYLKGGIGTNLTPYGEFYYNNLRSRTESYGVHARHLSSGGKIKDYGYPGFSDTEIEIHGKKLMRKHSISGNLSNSFNKIHHYGFLEADTLIDKGLIRQRFNRFEVQGELASYFKDSAKFNHNVQVGYYNYSDLYNAAENNLKIYTLLNRKIGKHTAEGTLGFDFNNYSADSATVLGNPTVIFNPATTNNTIAWFNPRIKTFGDNWQARVGFNIMADMGAANRIHFYPDAEFKLDLFNSVFIPYVGATGGLERNSFRTLSETNPFVLSNLTLQNTNRKWELYGGIRGSLSSSMSFNVRAAHYRLEGLPLYVNDTTFSIQNRFLVIYDSLNVTKISAELSYHQLERLKLYGRFDYFNFGTGNELFAWNLPTAQFTFSGAYDIDRRAHV